MVGLDVPVAASQILLIDPFERKTDSVGADVLLFSLLVNLLSYMFY